MKAISLWQPWAQWIAERHKTIETRTHDRFKALVGQRIAIHAAKRVDPDALRRAGLYWPEPALMKIAEASKNLGVIVCTAYVCESRPLCPADAYAALIECKTPRFGLILDFINKLDPPIPCKGMQGIFEVDIKE